MNQTFNLLVALIIASLSPNASPATITNTACDQLSQITPLCQLQQEPISIPKGQVLAAQTPSQAPSAFRQATIELQAATPPNPNNFTAKKLDADVLFSLVNTFRVESGLKPFQKEDGLCTLAQARALELHGEIFGATIMHQGLSKRDYPYKIAENIISNKSEIGALNWWPNSPIHHQTLVGNYSYSCVSCFATSCSQLFTNFEQKPISLTQKVE